MSAVDEDRDPELKTCCVSKCITEGLLVSTKDIWNRILKWVGHVDWNYHPNHLHNKMGGAKYSESFVVTMDWFNKTGLQMTQN